MSVKDIPWYYLLILFTFLASVLGIVFLGFTMLIPLLIARLRFSLERRRWPELEQEVEEGRLSPFELFLYKGLSCFENVMISRAIAYFQQAIGAHPLSPEGYYFLGMAYLNSPYFRGRQVEETFLQALERRDDHAESRFMLAMFYLELGLYSKATEEFARLPREFSLRGMGDTLGKKDLGQLEGQALTYPRMSRSERLALAVLCLIQLVVLSVVASHGLWSLSGISLALLILQIYWFAQMGRALSLSSGGITLHNWFRSLHFTWEELQDLVNEQGRGFWLVLKDRAIYISKYWWRSEDLVRATKAHLYHIRWQPHFVDFRRPRWVHD